ncbi:MAG: hypothetical protein WCP01_05040 [Methylococcaceae bacterium]
MGYKKIVVILWALLTSAVTFSQEATDDFTGKWKMENGKWKTAEGNSVVISKTGVGFIGQTVEKKIVVLKDINFSDGK